MWSSAKVSFDVRVDASRAFWFQQLYRAVHQNQCLILRGRNVPSVAQSVLNHVLFPISSKAVST